jgi:hypothetical protein
MHDGHMTTLYVISAYLRMLDRCHEYCSHMSNMRKYAEITDNVVIGPSYINI